MFRISVLIVLLVTIVLYWKNRKQHSLNQLKNQLLQNLKADRPGFLKQLRMFSFAWSALLFVLLGLSGFLPELLTGHHMSGFILVLHVLLAPFFLIAFTFWIFASVKRQAFIEKDWQIFKQGWTTIRSHQPTMDKLFFWSFFLLSLIGIGAIILSLFPLFSSSGIGNLIGIHRYVMLLLFLIAVVFYFRYFSLNQKIKIEEK
ncbi:MAG: hypothetical protein J7L94_11840 [Caldisericaceae bacterium]|nr:hypothetical protein [Caldisericaceae bacterium]